MAFVPIPNGVRIVHLGIMAGQQVVNTHGCQNGASEIGTDLGVLAKAAGDAWRARMVPQFPDTYQHVDTLAYSLENASLAPGDAAYASAVPGGHATAGGPIMPASACFVATLKTAKRGRTYTGRMYLPAYVAPMTDARTWAPAAVNAYQTAINSYKADVDPAAGDNGRMAVCSKGSPVNGITPHAEPVTGIIVRNYVGTQRRRVN